MLEHFRLPLRQKIRRLSQGQRAESSLGLAIAPDPDLLILDDPTLGLDTVARREFLVSLIQLIQREGRTIFYSSHILSDVERVADRIGILVDGELRVDCPTECFKQSVRKVLLEFAGPPPKFPGCEGLVNAWEIDGRLELVIVNFGDAQRQVIESLRPLSWDVMELNLEDAFIEYTAWTHVVPSGRRPPCRRGVRRGAATRGEASEMKAQHRIARGPTYYGLRFSPVVSAGCGCCIALVGGRLFVFQWRNWHGGPLHHAPNAQELIITTDGRPLLHSRFGNGETPRYRRVDGTPEQDSVNVKQADWIPVWHMRERPTSANLYFVLGPCGTARIGIGGYAPFSTKRIRSSAWFFMHDGREEGRRLLCRLQPGREAVHRLHRPVGISARRGRRASNGFP